MLRFALVLVSAARATALAAPARRAPALTLYRDNNGWCPFCERVWIALEKKGVPYDEVLINLQNKPAWYLEMVPTALVPAVEFHDEDWSDGVRGSGALVWESADILSALDERFGDPLVGAESPAQKAALATSFGFVYGNTTDAAAADAAAAAFSEALDGLDAALAANGARGEGPFINGAMTAADLELIPTMERFAHQLAVLKPDFPEMTAGRPALATWFDAVARDPAYATRVAGDAYSWTAVTSSFLRIFAKEEDEETAAKIARADAAAAALLVACRADGAAFACADARADAADALEKNRARVAADAADPKPKTQAHVPRCLGVRSADRAIDVTLRALRSGDLGDALDGDARVAATAIAARLCAPRDMGAPAAAALRHALLRLAAE